MHCLRRHPIFKVMINSNFPPKLQNAQCLKHYCNKNTNPPSVVPVCVAYC